MPRRQTCSNCRKIKRKCDGNEPCSGCIRRKAYCEFNQEDRRHQRFSTGYVKSLETNIQFIEGIMAHLVRIRDDPESVAAKLESLAPSYSGTSDLFASDLKIQPRKNDPNLAPIIASKNQYFGPGSIYHYRNADDAPLIALGTEDCQSESEDCLSDSGSFSDALAGDDCDYDTKALLELPVTIEEDFGYVSKLVHDYIEDCHPCTALLVLDVGTVLPLLEQHNFATPFLSKPLVYALCSLNERITYKESQNYFKLSLKMLLHKQKFNLSLAISQTYTLLGMHAILKGESSRGWNLLGLGRSVGMDVGFDESHAHGEAVQAIYNRCYMATLLIETYLSLAVGRKRTMARITLPILKLSTESTEDFLNLKYSIELVEYTKHMLRSTYQPVHFHEDSSINYLVKFNRAKRYNILVLQWKQGLEPLCDWLIKSMRNDKNLADRNHILKVTFYYIVLFLNKPFYHVPKKYSTVFLIEEMANELYLIVLLYLKKMEHERQINIPSVPEFKIHDENELYCSASMEICVLMVLCHVLVTLILSQPDQYSHLGKHFKLFAVYLSFCTPRKYNAPINPIKLLWDKYMNFKNAENTFQKYDGLKIDRIGDGFPVSESGTFGNDVSSTDINGTNSEPNAASESGSNEGFKASPRTMSDTESHTFEPILSQDFMRLDPNAPSNFLRFLNDEKLLDVYNEENKPNWIRDAPKTNTNVPNNGVKIPPQVNLPNTHFQDNWRNEDDFQEQQHVIWHKEPRTCVATNYDQMGVFDDPLDQLFSNSGQEFEVPHPMVDWDLMFQTQYANASI